MGYRRAMTQDSQNTDPNPDQDKPFRPEARAPRGFADKRSQTIAVERRIINTVSAVYEAHGFEALQTPAFEYADALGKFLPDADRPNEGVFALQDDDEQWMALRYDLTAPLARFGATRSLAPAATASSSSATPTRSARRARRPTPRSSPWPWPAMPPPACRPTSTC